MYNFITLYKDENNIFNTFQFLGFLWLMNCPEQSLIRKISYAETGNILTSDIKAGRGLTNMFFLLTKSASQLWFLDRKELFGQ